MKNILLLITLFFGCAENAEYYSNTSKDFREKSYEVTKHVGAYCSENCIWSKYAVDLNIHQSSEQCVEGSCDCVENGNAYNLCENNPTENITNVIQTTENNQDKNSEIPYYNQYDNVNYGWATCQNTSVAMFSSLMQVLKIMFI